MARGAKVAGSERNGLPESGGYVYHGKEPYLGPDHKEQQELTEAELEPGPCPDCGYFKGSLNCKVLCGRQRYRRG